MAERALVVVLGTGGHAAVCLDVLRTAGHEVAGCLGPAGSGRPLQVPVLGDDSLLARLRADGVTRAFVAVGDNGLRRRLMRAVADQGLELVAAVSPAATVSSEATIAPGAVVMPGAVVNAYARIGRGAIVNTGATVDHDCRIGDYVHVAPGVNVAGTVTVGEGAFLGVGCSVVPELTIGEWSVVGAGSLVLRDIPPQVVAFGAPARNARELHDGQ